MFLVTNDCVCVCFLDSVLLINVDENILHATALQETVGVAKGGLDLSNCTTPGKGIILKKKWARTRAHQ